MCVGVCVCVCVCVCVYVFIKIRNGWFVVHHKIAQTLHLFLFKIFPNWSARRRRRRRASLRNIEFMLVVVAG